MARQISMDAGLAAYRKKCAELLDANILLEAQLSEIEAELERLREQAGPPAVGLDGSGAAPAE